MFGFGARKRCAAAGRGIVTGAEGMLGRLCGPSIQQISGAVAPFLSPCRRAGYFALTS